MSKNEAKLRTQFRPIPNVQAIHQAMNQDPAFTYRNVIMTYKHDPSRIHRFLEAGWEIVEDTTPNRDDRSFTPNASKEDKLRPQMKVDTTSDGHEQILMRILTSTWNANQAGKKADRDMLRLREAQRRGDRITKRGNEVITRGVEVNETFQEL